MTHEAADRDDVAALTRLLDGGAPVDGLDRVDATPLRRAVLGGHVPACTLLLDRGADVDAARNGSFTALHLAAQEGHADVCALLLARGAAVDARRNDDETPLMSAACEGHAAVVDVLLAAGADTGATNAWGAGTMHCWATHVVNSVHEGRKNEAQQAEAAAVAESLLRAGASMWRAGDVYVFLEDAKPIGGAMCPLDFLAAYAHRPSTRGKQRKALFATAAAAMLHRGRTQRGSVLVARKAWEDAIKAMEDALVAAQEAANAAADAAAGAGGGGGAGAGEDNDEGGGEGGA